MKFSATELPGVTLVDVEPHTDERGYFARTWCAREFAAAGLRDRMVQGSIAFNLVAGTLRGLHYTAAAFPQARLVRIVQGAAYLAVLDLRRSSPTYLQHLEVTFDSADARSIYTPPGGALGYQTLAAETVVYYLMPEFYAPEHERGVRWNDPAFAIPWPDAQRTINARDAGYPDFDPARDAVEGV